jgi:hypothetical protein
MARPLTKIDQKGALYKRPSTIEAQINTALTQNHATLSQRARVANRDSPDYLFSECLVHLIRHAIRLNDQRLALVLMPPLLVRCEANLMHHVSDGRLRNAEAVREEILSSFQLLFTDDAAEDALDYYECKFNRAFRSLRINHVRAEINARSKLTDLPEKTTAVGDTTLDADALARLSRAARTGASQEDQVYLREVLNAVNALPPAQRRAFVLRRILGYTEESAAAEEGVTGRTMRNRVERADARLKKLKEDL